MAYGAGKFGRANGAVAVQGFAQLQAALRRIEDGSQAELRARLRVVGEHVKDAARGNVPHKTGRHGEGPHIEDALKVSVVAKGASVYTTAPQGGAINVGAWVKTGRGPHIKRADASHYMDRAVSGSTRILEAQTQAVMDWLITTFEE